MKPMGYHVTLRLYDDRVIAPTAGERRLVARVVLKLGRRYRVVIFRVVDTHLHFIALCDATSCAKLVQAITSALQHRLRFGVPFQHGRRKPIVDQQHLYAAFRYILRQEAHHGVDSDPFQDGSGLADLVGLRSIDQAMAVLVRQHLPRIMRAELLRSLGVAALDDVLVDPFHLAEAAAAAFALPDLRSRRDLTVLARRAAVHAAATLPSRDLAALLGLSMRTIERLRGQAVPPAARFAVEQQLRLRAALANRARAAAIA